MTRRIFRAVLFIVWMTFLIFYTLMLRVMFDYLGEYQRSEMLDQIRLIATGIEMDGVDYLDKTESIARITWIDSEGRVLFDNMDEDLVGSTYDSDLIQRTRKSGFEYDTAEAPEFSGEAAYMTQELDDESIIQLMAPQRSMFTIMRGMMTPILIILGVVLAVVLDYAFQMSRDIVKPLNELDLEHPLENTEYQEIMPLLKRIDTQQKELALQEEELEVRRSEFQTIMDSMEEGLLMLRPDGTIVTGNHLAYSLLSANGDELAGKNIEEFTGNKMIREMINEAKEGLHGEEIFHYDDNYYQVTADPVLNDEKEVIGITSTVLNVTEREALEKVRREFTANVSHELKTPLHTISGSAELLKNNIVKEEDKQGFYDRIYSESQRMIGLVEDIMNVSESDNDDKNIEKEKVDLYQICQEAVDEQEVIADRRGIEISLKGEPTEVMTSKKDVTTIINNLVSNAVKYNVDNGSVYVNVYPEKETAVVEVKDTGIGIAVQDQQRIFERFYRVDKSRSRQAGGTGLGLSIVKNLVRRLGGTIELESALNQGSLFRVTLPNLDQEN